MSVQALGGALEKGPVAQQVVDRVLGMIRSGNLRPGDRLPTEAEMAAAFGISRPSLREALKALVLMGVLTSRQGGRTSVAPLSLESLLSPLAPVLQLNAPDLDDHYEARCGVEGSLAAHAARRADADERERLLRLAAEGRRLVGNPVAFRLNDMEFHDAIYRAGRSEMLATLARSLYDIGLDARRKASEHRANVERSVAQHAGIADRIAAGDAVRTFEIPGAEASPNRYLAAVVAQSEKKPEAAAFVRALHSSAADEAWSRHGFSPASS